MALFTRRKHDERDIGDGADRPITTMREPATIGDLLRVKREAYGVSIIEVGATLRIRPAFLEAIEDNRYDRLPGAAYALGFVRTYAEYLGLDGDAMARRFKGEVAGFEPKRDLAFPMPLTERSLPGGAVLLVALIVAACAYAVWYYRASGDRARPERVAEAPSQVIALPPSDDAPPTVGVEAPPSNAPAVAASDGSGSASAIAPPPAAPSGQAPETSPSAVAPVPVVVPPPPPAPGQPASTQPASSQAAANQAAANQAAASQAVPEPPPAPVASNAPRVFGPTTGPVRIVLKAISDSWIQVREPNQSVLSMRTLKAGDSYRVPDRAGLTLRTGNAGGLEVTVDGRQVAPIGPAGKSRTVALDPDKLAAGSAAAE